MSADVQPVAVDNDEEVHVWYGSELLEEFHGLRSGGDAHRRGHKLESLLERAFRKAHYRVVHNAGIAKPRQTDFVASLGNDRYLVEAKWEKDPVDVSVVGGIRDRMSRTDASVVGVIMTVSGINDDAAQDIVLRRDRGLVLVFTEADILKGLKDPHELDRMLRHKHDELVVHGRLDRGRDIHEEKVKSSRRPKPLPKAHYKMLDLERNEIPWFACAGEFSPFVFVLDLPDIDWVPAPGSGVCLDVPVPAWSQSQLVDLLRELDDMGWMTPQAQWSVQQHEGNWHGTGPSEFVETLKKWKARTDALADPHHSEEFSYFDTCDGGFYTISGILSASRQRQLRQCVLSFQLTGIPLDPNPLKHLYARFDAPRRGYFRPLGERSVVRQRFAPGVALKVLGYVLEPGEESFDRTPWAVGLAVENPFLGESMSLPEDWPPELRDSSMLVCALLSHHQIDEPRESYHLSSIEVARTSDSCVIRAFADW